MRVRALSNQPTQTLSWLWPGRLALGKLAMLDGDPGLGKSHLALDLCARLSTGRPFPDDRPGPGIASAIVFNAEDGEGDTTRPRLERLGADLDRIYSVEPDDADSFRLPTSLPALEDLLSATSARLVVLDPVVAFLDSTVCVGSDQSVRSALAPLARLADRFGCAVLLVRHLNKKTAPRSLYRGSGSIGFLGLCRSGWLVAADPDDPARRVLAQVKNNLAPPQPSLLFSLEGEARTSCLHWHGPSPYSADQLLATKVGPPAPTPRDRARDFILEMLHDGPRTSRELWDTARARGLAERTLYRAARELQVRVERRQEDGIHRYYWLLPDQKLPPATPPDPTVPDLEDWLAPLRTRYPPPTPLDEL